MYRKSSEFWVSLNMEWFCLYGEGVITDTWSLLCKNFGSAYAGSLEPHIEDEITHWVKSQFDLRED